MPTETTVTAVDVPPPDAPGAEPVSDEASSSASPPVAEGETSDPGSAPEAEEKGEKEPGKPPTERESAIARNLRKREAKVVERSEQLARERSEFEAYKARVEPQVRAFEQERDLARKDPFAWLEKTHGIREEDLARRWLNGGKPAPEEEQAKARRADEERLARLEAALKEREQRETQERQARELVELKTTFHGNAVKQAAKFPYVAAVYGDDADGLFEVADRVARQIVRETGAKVAPWDVVLSRIDATERARIEKAQRGLNSSKPATENAASQAATKGTENAGRKGSEADTPAPTLSGKKVTERATLPKVDPLLLSPEEERRRVLEAIEAARKGKSAA